MCFPGQIGLAEDSEKNIVVNNEVFRQRSMIKDDVMMKVTTLKESDILKATADGESIEVDW